MKVYNIILLLICSFLGCTNGTKNKADTLKDLPYYQETTFTPVWMSSEMIPDTFHRVGAFRLLNQDSLWITDETFENKIYVTDFFFTTCPGICPKMMDNLNLVQEAFIDDPEVLILSHSVTPERDSVSVLKNYAEAKGIRSGKWHLVTGKTMDIYRLGRKAYFVEEDLGIEKDIDEFLHTENFVLVDGKGHLRGIYNGLRKASVRQLIKDIHLLKKSS